MQHCSASAECDLCFSERNAKEATLQSSLIESCTYSPWVDSWTLKETGMLLKCSHTSTSMNPLRKSGIPSWYSRQIRGAHGQEKPLFAILQPVSLTRYLTATLYWNWQNTFRVGTVTALADRRDCWHARAPVCALCSSARGWSLVQECQNCTIQRASAIKNVSSLPPGQHRTHFKMPINSFPRQSMANVWLWWI